MTIEIIEAEKIKVMTFEVWSCELWVTQAGTTYALPATAPGELLQSELLAYFETREAQLWQEAQVGNQPLTTPEKEAKQAPGGARQWFIDNPNGKLLFTLSIPDLSAEIAALVDALFPVATASNRTKLKLLLMGIAVSVRVLVRRELI